MTGTNTADDRTVDELTAGDDVTVTYESVYGDGCAANHSVSGTVEDASRVRITVDGDDGDDYDIIVDGGVATELKKRDSNDNPRRIGYVAGVAVQSDEVRFEDLTGGTTVELSYTSTHGPQTRVCHVVEHTTSESIIDENRIRHEVTLADPTAETTRFVQFTSTTESDTLEYSAGLVVRSLNSKSDRGKRMGRITNLSLCGTSERHEAVAEFRAAEVGDGVTLHGDDEYVVVERYLSTWLVVEDPRTGHTVYLYGRADGVQFRDSDKTLDSFRRTGSTFEDEAAVDLWNEIISHTGLGDLPPVEALILDGDRYEIVYRHKADEQGVHLASEAVDESRRKHDALLSLTPLGLELTTGRFHDDRDAEDERLDTDDVTLVREIESEDEGAENDESDASDDADDETAEDTEKQESGQSDDESAENSAQGDDHPAADLPSQALPLSKRAEAETTGVAPEKLSVGNLVFARREHAPTLHLARVVEVDGDGAYALTGNGRRTARLETLVTRVDDPEPLLGVDDEDGEQEKLVTDGGREVDHEAALTPGELARWSVIEGGRVEDLGPFETVEPARRLTADLLDRLADRFTIDTTRTGPGSPEGAECPECEDGTLDDTGECGECGTIVMADGGDTTTMPEDRNLSQLRHERLEARLAALDDAIEAARERGADTLVREQKRRQAEVRRELSRRLALREQNDTQDKHRGDFLPSVEVEP